VRNCVRNGNHTCMGNRRKVLVHYRLQSRSQMLLEQ
jgi:hypothetical protein